MNGRRVTTLRRLEWLCDHGRCVSCHVWKNPMPVAFLMGMPARVVAQFINRGLYEYKKEK